VASDTIQYGDVIDLKNSYSSPFVEIFTSSSKMTENQFKKRQNGTPFSKKGFIQHL